MKRLISIILLCLITISLAAKTYTISENGMEFIKQYEKCVLTAYADGGGWSIGYGHHGEDVVEGMTITKEQANKFFAEDIKKVSASVKRLIEALPYEYEFSQGFIDGMFSLVYNCGEGGVKSSTFYQRLLKCRVIDGEMNDEDFKYTIAGVKESKISAPGHVKRRYDEHVMMLS